MLDLLRRWLPGWFPAPSLGRRGEDAAARYLRKRGYVILARGERSRLGEIDLVAADGRTVVFVEVKTRRHDEQGLPAEAVDAEKQRRVTRAALAWLKARGLLDAAARFDVVSVTWPAGRGRPEVSHVPSAFEAAGYEGFFS